MKTVSLACPRCGAPIEEVEAQNLCKCPYCESVFCIELTEQTGMERESGKACAEAADNRLEAARRAIENRMYDRAYELYGGITLDNPQNSEADIFSHLLYLKSHIRNFAEFNRLEFSDRAKAFVRQIVGSDMTDSEKQQMLSSLLFLLNEISIDMDQHLAMEFGEADDDGTYRDLFSCRYIILEIADELWELYPDNEMFRSLYITEWAVQIIWIKDKERISETREKLRKCGFDGTGAPLDSDGTGAGKGGPKHGCLATAGIICLAAFLLFTLL